MSTAPGWYDAGTPGRLRWWDGTQWTEHETAAPAVVTVAGEGPEPGWYEAASGPVRWWDGRQWTGMRFKNGVPGIDWATAEQPGAAWAFGGVFLALGAMQFALGALTQPVSFGGAATILLAVLWFAIAATSSAVRRIARPTGAPLVVDVVRPLPGEQEGPGAGWYPIGSGSSRWWTGARWTQYTNTRFGIRPTFHGARAYRIYLGLSWGVVGLGVVLLIAAVLMLVAGADGDGLLTAIGVVMLFGGILFGILGIVILALSPLQRRLLLLPTTPPRG